MQKKSLDTTTELLISTESFHFMIFQAIPISEEKTDVNAQ
jgi:hypothetical protein